MPDSDGPHTHHAKPRLLSKSSGLVLGLLALLAVATWGFGQLGKTRLVNDLTSAQLRTVQSALDQVENEFRKIQGSMVDEARALATNPRLIRALRIARTGVRDGEEDIIRIMSAYQLHDQGAVEIYDQQPRLLGWAGASLPIDSAPSEPNFLDSYQSSLAMDGDRHSALVIWWPIRDGIETVGAVRVIRMIVQHVPVRNEFLRDYTLDEEWSRLTTYPVRVDLMPEPEFDPSESRFSRTLQGADGRTLVRVHITPPSDDRLIAEQRTNNLNFVYLWVMMGLFVVLFIAARWTLRPEADHVSVMNPVGRFMVFLSLIAGVRYSFLALEIPSRWQTGKAPLSPLFDPQHLASGYGGGIMQTSGDLLLSALMAVAVAVLFVRVTERVRTTVRIRFSFTPNRRSREGWGIGDIRLLSALALHMALVLGLLSVFGHVSQRAILDSTLDFFERSGLLPDQLVLGVFASLILITFSVVFLCSRSIWVCLELFKSESWDLISRGRVATLIVLTGTVSIGVAFIATNISGVISLPATVFFVLVVYGIAYFSPMRSERGLDWLHFRSIVPSVVLVSMILYPLLDRAMTEDRRMSIEHAADSFEEDMDSRVVFAIGQLLNRVDEIDLVEFESTSETIAHYDSLARALIHGELISALGTHDISVVLFTADGEPLGRYNEFPSRGSRKSLDAADFKEFGLIRAMYADKGDSGALIEKMTGDRERERFVYAGFYSFGSDANQQGWLLVRAQPHEIAREGAQAFPRVLVPAGYYGDDYTKMSLAEFQDGVMVRNYGRPFGRYNLDSEVDELLRVETVLWRTEQIREGRYLTLYRRLETDAGIESSPTLGSRVRIIAVRISGISLFDHLYYLLRVTIAGLFLGVPIYLIGIVWRIRKGLLPAKKIQFQNKVLNAFFAVGLITVTVTGWVGLKVVTGENERAIESWLRQHLLRVEDALTEDARSEELPYRVLERTNLDSLARRVGLDLNIYRATELESSSRPQLVRERLVDTRLPIQAYEALYFDGYRFVSVNQSLGTFVYTAGYRALTDERGDTRYVISLPTLPEQERIEEERARTVAYLFGALLLLVFVVMVTAALLANALARPIGKLREGLESVSEGRFESIGPVGSRDEISDLVDSFNTMQSQLSESRDLLAKQERQLAWREMARQVAHEIKNPLTPMKLSIQHLRTAFARMKPSPGDGGDSDGFENKFNRTTTTLIEQIDALARIADGFSSFGSMPHNVKEPLEVNAVVQAAVDLMRNETDTKIEANLVSNDLMLDGDEEALRRVFINLIKNAIQAIPEDREGLITLTTRVDSSDEESRFIEATVMDNGSGIRKELWDKIFVPSFSTKTSGTGLGLAIAQKTVEDFDGDISFETESGVGSTFRVRLPFDGD
ncbi:MAG: HAMP domain-containing sensor histidine kinase [Bacteroidetes bacterium]|nr:MAG: HAMP domain-containing sensor histidine kinase [Bacteroidota bacterium]